MEVSLFQSGKSRADLWELAGLVALEMTLERANRACDLDFHARHQVRLEDERVWYFYIRAGYAIRGTREV